MTGSSKGIGFGIAKRFAEEGGLVHICSRNKNNVDQAVAQLTSKGHTVFGHACNINKKDERIAMLKDIAKRHGGALDVLVPNVSSDLYTG